MDKSFTKENHVQMVGPDKVTNNLNCIRVCPDNSNSRNSLSLVVRCGRATIKKELGEAGWNGEERFEIVKLIVRCIMLLCCWLLHFALSFLFLLLFERSYRDFDKQFHKIMSVVDLFFDVLKAVPFAFKHGSFLLCWFER